MAWLLISYFPVPKYVRLNSTHYLIKEIHNKRELQHIANNNSTDNHYKDFMNIDREHTCKPYSFLTIDTTLAANTLLSFRRNLLDSLY